MGNIVYELSFQTLAAQKSHRKIAVTTVAASAAVAAIPLQKSQGFLLRRSAAEIARSFASAAAKKNR